MNLIAKWLPERWWYPSLQQTHCGATGINFFAQEVTAKRLGLLHELVPKAGRIAMLVNPGSPAAAESTLTDAREAARVLGLQIVAINASTIGEIDAAFAAMARERTDALFVMGDGFFNSRRVQFTTLAARDRLPACYVSREYVEVGGLMNYGTNLSDMFRQAGIYAGSILKGAKPADLPVLQPTKFEFVINLQTGRSALMCRPCCSRALTR
jgi:putative ABC transport system substrate-binding protein